MQLKEGAVPVVTEAFWYDLVDGGYIDPRHLLDNDNDIKKVFEAIETLEEFQEIATEEV